MGKMHGDSRQTRVSLMGWSHFTTGEVPMSYRLVTDAKSPIPGRAPAGAWWFLRHRWHIGSSSVDFNAELKSTGDLPMSTTSVTHRWHIGRAPAGDCSDIGRFLGLVQCRPLAGARSVPGRQPAGTRPVAGQLSADTRSIINYIDGARPMIGRWSAGHRPVIGRSLGTVSVWSWIRTDVFRMFFP